MKLLLLFPLAMQGKGDQRGSAQPVKNGDRDPHLSPPDLSMWQVTKSILAFEEWGPCDGDHACLCFRRTRSGAAGENVLQCLPNLSG